MKFLIFVEKIFNIQNDAIQNDATSDPGPCPNQIQRLRQIQLLRTSDNDNSLLDQSRTTIYCFMLDWNARASPSKAIYI